MSITVLVINVKILHVDENNPAVSYYLDANELESSDMEKDLGVLVDHINKLKFDQHINETVKKSNTLVGMIKHYRPI